MSDYARPESIVSTQWLTDHLDDSQVRLIEVIWGQSPSFGTPAYETGHIPGALAWDFERELQDPECHDILNKAGIQALLSKSSITPEMAVVLYSGLNNLLATFAFWFLKIYGHKDVRLLDGDRQKWWDEGRPTTRQVPAFTPATYHAREPDWSLRVGREEVLQSIGKAKSILVDARSVEMYSGLDKAGAVRGGHIPGAINLTARRETHSDGSFKAWRVPTVQADGTFKPARELQTLFDDLEIPPDKEIITYCVRSGLSTHAWFVLTQLLGYPQVREYDRSWAEWGNLESVPIEVAS